MDTKFGFPKVNSELKNSFRRNILQSVILLIAFDSVEDIISKGERLGAILGKMTQIPNLLISILDTVIRALMIQ